MKKVLMLLGGVFLALVIVGIAVITIVAVKGSALDKESKQYADAAIPAIVSDWDIKELEQRTSPEFKSVLKDGDLEKLFGMFRRLGKLKEFKGCKGASNISFTSEHGKVVSAAYVGSTEFEAGPAEIQLSLIKHGDQWQILGFRVNSKAFLEQP
jgi:hypothetical protein